MSIDLAVIGGAIVAILTFIGTLLFKAKKAGVDQQKAKEADSYEKHIQDIADAAGARPSGGVQSDPHNRDNQK
ncbi:hypothetical protein [Mesorhizobium sp. M4B.F.Ca.ET.017.02.2.1]|uniref:hypothetical protein n=1 Tax=Mesorhizobium sp. M4B.F.Ca.ET.017.02.2.1 TaxID=2496649 RepID=UPI000FCB9A2C|nr:hypothetical protein [Mesorhizobium sp. M4B.F.Ca.ET.017.02.2.1]RVD31414.1 hypothetical protein EN738_01800 [Mesorhizobium sp. M4B.F.Ca.ET.017.02.2.1]